MRKQKLISKEARSLFPDGYRVLQGRQEFVTYPDDSTIRMWYGVTPDTFTLHWHTAMEILLVLEGECESGNGDGSFVVGKDEVVIMPPRCPHTLSMGEGGRRCLFLFEMDALEKMRDFAPLLKMSTQSLHITAQHPQHDDIVATLNQIITLYRFREPLWNTMCYSLLMQMLAKLGRNSLIRAYEQEPSPQHRRLAASPQVMESVLGYINQNYMKDITLEEMATYAGYSKWYFSRVFKQYTGVSYMQYLTQVRVSHIRQALIDDRTSVTQIYEHSGFSSISTFNRAFKEVTGCAPSEYRAIYGKRRGVPGTIPDDTK